MKKIFFLIAFASFYNILFAQSNDSIAVFDAKFLNHELQTYSVSSARYTVTQEDTASLEKLFFSADVYVKDSLDSGNIISWKFYDFRILSPKISYKKLLSSSDSLVLSYSTNKAGEFLEFINGEDADKFQEKVLLKLLNEYSTDKTEVESLVSFNKYEKALMINLIGYYNMPFGMGYKLNKIVDVPKMRFYSLTDDAILDGTFRKKLTKIDSKKNISILSWAFFAKDTSRQRSIYGSFLMDNNTGWPIFSFLNNEIDFFKKKIGTSIEINLK